MSIPTILKGFDYLVNIRKLNETTIRNFHLAFCDENGEIYIGAEFTGTLPSLDKRFYNSAIFPIQNVYGEVIGISARPLGPTNTKYCNTVYEKADHLYGLSQTYKDCLKERKCYVVEGNISMLTPYQAGLKNIVAMLGSNFSPQQLCLLSRFVTKIVFVPDADGAGSKFIEKLKKNISTKFMDSDIEFYYIQLPSGYDPDEYLQEHTLAEFKALPEIKL